MPERNLVSQYELGALLRVNKEGRRVEPCQSTTGRCEHAFDPLIGCSQGFERNERGHLLCSLRQEGIRLVEGEVHPIQRS